MEPQDSILFNFKKGFENPGLIKHQSFIQYAILIGVVTSNQGIYPYDKNVYLCLMMIKDEILKQVADFRTLCQKHKVKYLYAFGSATTDSFDYNKSDIDLLVEIDDTDPIERGEQLISLWDTFELFFHRKVDLLTDSSIRNPYLRKNIDSTKILIYDGKGSKIFI